MKNYSDNTILTESLKNGNEEAFAYLVDTYHHKLCVYANTLVKDVYCAEDIVQNVFAKVWEKRNRLNPDYAIKSFLYKSVYNEFIDHYRKNISLLSLEKKHFKTLNEILLDDDSESLNEVIEIVKKEIQNLPPKCKEVFILSKQQGLTNNEIAEYLNVSVKAVEAQITKAFSILRSSMKEKIKSFLFLLFGHKKWIAKN
ncbi:RNA polymerase sigma factor [Flavobacterium sp. 102]|uniref:RNA polymerase sigma factor n=1 Tax=Flavobacterium sp. 102 TaxID=2135623 RepID=UPI000F0D6392|nr:RNA polymerase sigma-70 factor [Flavobacterium sp. 102]RKS03049.1 RNA polymerase sigma-70 factor (ECF subfamily) [Flavobacterium sp. 102]